MELIKRPVRKLLAPIVASLSSISEQLERIEHRLNSHLDDYGSFEERVTAELKLMAETLLLLQRNLNELVNTPAQSGLQGAEDPRDESSGRS